VKRIVAILAGLVVFVLLSPLMEVGVCVDRVDGGSCYVQEHDALVGIRYPGSWPSAVVFLVAGVAAVIVSFSLWRWWAGPKKSSTRVIA
jgi:hypothetical protein